MKKYCLYELLQQITSICIFRLMRINHKNCTVTEVYSYVRLFCYVLQCLRLVHWVDLAFYLSYVILVHTEPLVSAHRYTAMIGLQCCYYDYDAATIQPCFQAPQVPATYSMLHNSLEGIDCFYRSNSLGKTTHTKTLKKRERGMRRGCGGCTCYTMIVRQGEGQGIRGKLHEKGL